jgi:hypothetical protein
MSNEGKKYFNLAYDKIEVDRENNGDKFDDDFLEYMRNESEEGKRLDKHQMKKSKPVLETIVIRNDWERSQQRNKRKTSMNLKEMNNELVKEKKGSKKHRRELSDEEIAAEQGQKLGATCVFVA